MDFFGLVAEAPVLPAAEPFYLWPENEPAWALFHACATQWRSGMAGREGLDYEGVRIVMAYRRIRPRQRRQRFREVQVMEAIALQEWGRAQEENK